MKFCAERELRVDNTYFERSSLHKYTRGGKNSRRSGGKEHDRSGASEEGYVALCAGWEGSGRNGTRPLGSPCCTMQSHRLVGAWIKRREVVVGARRIRS